MSECTVHNLTMDHTGGSCLYCLSGNAKKMERRCINAAASLMDRYYDAEMRRLHRSVSMHHVQSASEQYAMAEQFRHEAELLQIQADNLAAYPPPDVCPVDAGYEKAQYALDRNDRESDARYYGGRDV